jgi:hypothetical protein
MANTAIIRDAYGSPATFVGSKTARDDAPFVLSGLETRNAGCDGLNGMRFQPGPARRHPGQTNRNNDEEARTAAKLKNICRGC